MKNGELTPDVANFLAKKQRVTNPIALSAVDNVSPELTLIWEQIASISGSWNPVEIYTATNQSTEKAIFLEKFIAGEVYNPRFEYASSQSSTIPEAKDEILELLHVIRQNKPTTRVDRLAKVALYFKLRDDFSYYRYS